MSNQNEFGIPVVFRFLILLSKSYRRSRVLVQIPAYLYRQTSILRASETKNHSFKERSVHEPMEYEKLVRKKEHYGNKKILLTDRDF